MARPGPASGLIVTVPGAEPAVRQHRARLDASAALGVPAHITVLFPFLPPGQIGAAVLAQLEQLFAGVPAFSFRLDHAGWFGEDVLWLGPQDPGPFRALTRRVAAAFPQCPPYAGAFDEDIPHLTVGEARPAADLRAAEEAVRACLPVEGRATAVTLITRRSAGGRWAQAAAFPLG
ncbi:MAG TPA: 2'-5' RNA ligase family protein [Streptosporangiaceae bacterium]|nr:2'-5' RNA ligase family protein [Streptosporangiaceae bacterium]